MRHERRAIRCVDGLDKQRRHRCRTHGSAMEPDRLRGPDTAGIVADSATEAYSPSSRPRTQVVQGNGLQIRSANAANPTKLGISEEVIGAHGAPFGAALAQTPELAMVVEQWPRLPEALRSGIIAMIRAALPGREA